MNREAKTGGQDREAKTGGQDRFWGSRETKTGVMEMVSPATTLGREEHEQPLMLGMMQALRGLSTDVQELKGAVYNHWEGPVGWTYVEKALELRREYGAACAKAKGTGRKVGGVKNYLLLAFFLAHQADPGAKEDNKRKMEELVGKLCRTIGGSLSIEKVQEVAHLVKHIEVAKGRGKTYLTIAMSRGVGADTGHVRRGLGRVRAEAGGPSISQAGHPRSQRGGAQGTRGNASLGRREATEYSRHEADEIDGDVRGSGDE